MVLCNHQQKENHYFYRPNPCGLLRFAHAFITSGKLDPHRCAHIGVQPWEKNMFNPVEKAIRESDLGLNPASMGDIIRVPMPALTEERRKELVKVVKQEAEGAKIAVRNIRRDANEQLKKLLKDKAVTEDEERRAQDDVQKMTDKFVAEIDKMITEKEAEILKV